MSRFGKVARATAPIMAVALAPRLYANAVRLFLRRNTRQLAAGNTAPLFASYADDVTFRFPGQSAWAADLRGKADVEGWVRRFLSVGMRLQPNEIVVNGPPRRTRACKRYTDTYTTSEGERVYANEGVFYIEIAWGKVRHYEVHEDTQKVAEFDSYLAAREATAAHCTEGEDASKVRAKGW